MSIDDAKDGKWVCVLYEDEVFIGKVVGKPVNGQVRVRCLEHPLGVSKPQKFEKESHVIYYHEIFHAQCEPFQVSVGRAWLWNYKL